MLFQEYVSAAVTIVASFAIGRLASAVCSTVASFCVLIGATFAMAIPVAPEFVVSGLVRDGSGAPIAGALVYVADGGMESIVQATGSDGFYKIGLRKAGRFAITATHGDLIQAEVICSEVTESGPIMNLDLILVDGLSITGTVRFDAGIPAARARIAAKREEEGEDACSLLRSRIGQPRAVWTSENNVFNLSPVMPNTSYTIICLPIGAIDYSIATHILAGADNVEVVASRREWEGLGIEGWVLDDEAGEPIVGAQVSAMGWLDAAGSPLPTDRGPDGKDLSNVSGKFEIVRLRAHDPYVITVTHPDWSKWTSPVIRAGGGYPVIARLRRDGDAIVRISGFNGAGLKGARVGLYLENPVTYNDVWNAAHEASVNDNGVVQFKDLSAGRYWAVWKNSSQAGVPVQFEVAGPLPSECTLDVASSDDAKVDWSFFITEGRPDSMPKVSLFREMLSMAADSEGALDTRAGPIFPANISAEEPGGLLVQFRGLSPGMYSVLIKEAGLVSRRVMISKLSDRAVVISL